MCSPGRTAPAREGRPARLELVPPSLERRSPRRVVAVLVLAGTGLVSFQGGLLRVAFPVIRAQLGASIAAMQAVSLAGLVVTTATVVAFGRLADVVGARRIYAAGLACFAAGNLASALAPSTGPLVAAQAAQGVGWSMVLSAGSPLLVRAFLPAERGRVVAANHMAVAVGLAAGPAAGGLAVEHLGWRVSLGALAPLALVLAGVVWARLPAEEHTPVRRHFDLTGACVLGLALAAVLVGLDANGRRGLGRPGTVAAAVVTAVAFAAFIRHEAHAPEPMVELGLFRERSYSAGLAASFLTFAAMASNMFLLPFFLQEVLGQSVAHAGAVMMVVPAGILAVAPVAGWWADRRGPRAPATVGALLVTVAIGLMARLGGGASSASLVGALAIYGAGAGLFQSPNNSGVFGAVPPERLGVASGTLSTLGRLGQVVGVAVAGALWEQGGRGGGGPDAAALASFHLAFAVLAVFGVLAAAASWLRGDVRAAAPPDAG